MIPTAISYNPETDRARVWLKGGAGPGEITDTARLMQNDVLLSFDAAGRLLLIDMPGEALHPDLSPFAKREYPAAGSL